jgi:protocatechuate 3,4-dioxygenase beta subunit
VILLFPRLETATMQRFIVSQFSVLCFVAVAVAAPVATQPLRGVVHAADGSPAADAIVWAANLESLMLERREAVADHEGRFSLSLSPGNWMVWARHDLEGGPANQKAIVVAAGKAPEPISIRLEERGLFRGRLLEEETGQPIARGKLFLDAGVVLTTDAAGKFAVGGLSRGNHEAFVAAPGRVTMRVLFDTTGRGDTELEVAVPRGGKIVGRVTDLDGKPIQGAYVGRLGSGSHFSMAALFVACDAEGRFEYDGKVLDQTGSLMAGAPGYVADQRDGLTIAPDGKAPVVEFRLRPNPNDAPNPGVPARRDEEKRRTVSGTVRGPDSKPVQGVLVRWGYQPFVGAIETRTDAEGRFQFRVPDEDNMIAVLPREFPPDFPKVPAGGDQSINVTLQSGRTARGKVTDDTDKPIKDVTVMAVVPSPNPRIGNPYWLRESEVQTDADGRFQLKGIPDHARFDFMKSGLSDLRNQDLNLDDVENAITMQYGGAITGRVVDRDGKPIRSFRVLVGLPHQRLPGDRSQPYFAGYSGMGVRFTASDGCFVLTGVGAGSVYRIRAIAPGHGEAVEDRVIAVPVNRVATTEPATLKAGPPVTLRVKVVTAQGKPVASARVTLVDGQPRLDQSFMWGYHNANWENMVRGRTAADGCASFPDLSFPGATILVEAPGFGRQRIGWRDGRRDLTVQLETEAIIRGRVRDFAGDPLQNFYVILMGGGDNISTRIQPDDKGQFRIAELPSGTWSVEIRAGDGESILYQETIELKPGEAKEMSIDTK